MSHVKLALVVGMVGLLLAGCTPIQQGLEAPSESPSPSAVFKGTASDYAAALAACMTKKDWPATAGSPDDADGGTSITYEYIPDDQQSAFDSDQTDCINELGILDDGLGTEAGLKAKYDWLIGQGHCLADAGYPIPDPPSFATVKDAYATTGVLDLDPMKYVPSDQYRTALAACPRSTKTWPAS